MLPALPIMTALDFNPQLDPLSDQISQINHNQSRPTWKDRIISVLPEVVSLALSAVVFGALWVSGVQILISGGAALVTFAGVYTAIELVGREIQHYHHKPLLSTRNPLNVAAPKKTVSPVPNDEQQTRHPVDVLKSHATIQDQRLVDAEHQRAVAVQLNKTLQDQNAALQETGQQIADQLQQLHLSHERHQTEIHDKDQEIAGLQQQSMKLEEQLTETRGQYSKCAQNRGFLRKRSESAESAVKKLSQELEQSIQIIDDYNASFTRSTLRLENPLVIAQQSQQAVQQLIAGKPKAQRELGGFGQDLNTVTKLLEKAQAQQVHLERQLEQFQNQKNNLNDDVEHKKSRYQAEMSQLREAHQKLEQERNQALQLPTAEKEASELRSWLSEFKREQEDKQSLLKKKGRSQTVQEDLENTSRKNQLLTQQLEILEAKVSEVDVAHEQLQRQKDQAVQLKTAAQQKVVKLQSALDNLNAELQKLQSKHRRLGLGVSGIARRVQGETAEMVAMYTKRHPERPPLSEVLQLSGLCKIESDLADTQSKVEPEPTQTPESTSVQTLDISFTLEQPPKTAFSDLESQLSKVETDKQ